VIVGLVIRGRIRTCSTVEELYVCLFVWNHVEDKFAKATLKLDRLNTDPEYLRGKICEAFPELSSGGRDSRMFKLWQVRENRTDLIPLPVDVNNAQALFTYEELNRSCVYIKADVSTLGKPLY